MREGEFLVDYPVPILNVTDSEDTKITITSFVFKVEENEIYYFYIVRILIYLSIVILYKLVPSANKRIFFKTILI